MEAGGIIGEAQEVVLGDQGPEAVIPLKPEQIYCDTCGYGLDPTLAGPHCEEGGVHLVDGPNGSRGQVKDYREFLASSRIREPFRMGGHRTSKRTQKRALGKFVRSMNRRVRRAQIREQGRIVGCGPSEKALARMDLREAIQRGIEAEELG